MHSVVVIKNESSVEVVTRLIVPVILPFPVPLNALIVGSLVSSWSKPVSLSGNFKPYVFLSVQ